MRDLPLRGALAAVVSILGFQGTSDLIAASYAVTYDYPVIVTRCTNNYGPYQFPEKFIPLFVTNILDGQKAPIYGTGVNERDWLYVEDHCVAIHLLVAIGDPGQTYNIGGAPRYRMSRSRRIVASLGVDEGWIQWVADRPGHDLRYAVDSSRIRRLGWSPAHGFDEHLEHTIAWYKAREDWWRPLKERLRWP